MPTDHLPEGDQKRQAVRTMFDTIAPRYDLVNRIMTFRMDVGLRKKTMKVTSLDPSSIVLDLAAGTGDFCIELQKEGHHGIGVDLSYGMLAAARTTAPLVQGDLLALPFPDRSVDGAVCGYALRNLVELPAFFFELARVVRPGGRIGLLDVSRPDNRLLRGGYDVYFNRVVPKIGALFSDAAAYDYLPRSLSYLPERQEMVAMLRHAGFTDAEHRQLQGGLSQLLSATRD
jgi:demethylmenaquinone methyltransferase/2-methoxy-6-polyprenyl-1,4-benzoquinol methylase